MNLNRTKQNYWNRDAGTASLNAGACTGPIERMYLSIKELKETFPERLSSSYWNKL
jgi:hypothetical protein